MTDPRQALTPDALAMMDTIARTGSFAAAARELGKVPSALTYSVRQLEEALDVLLFDRSSRQAQLTAAGSELLHEGRRLLQEMDAVANRVRRVASGWETQLSIGLEGIVSMSTVFEIVASFCQVRDSKDVMALGGPATRLRLRTDVLAGTWEALVTGQVDLAIGISGEYANPGGIEPHHPLALLQGPLEDAQLVHHRAVAVADSAQKLSPVTVNLLPGQDVLTVPSMRSKMEALLRGLGCGFVPEPFARAQIEAGRLVHKETARASPLARLHYAWRAERSALGLGRALQWWLAQLESPVTRLALLERHAGLLP